MTVLPPDVLAAIRRKASRAPKSKFINKLYIILEYAGDDLARQEMVGAGWVSNDSFRINKKKLVNSLEIKLNTLNVDLKLLQFRQIRGDFEGWTVWSREGFRRNGNAEQFIECKGFSESGAKTGSEYDEIEQMAMMRDIELGGMDSESVLTFKKFTLAIWEELVPRIGPKDLVSGEELLKAAAKRFRAPHQKYENAVQILQVVFIRPDMQFVSLLDFAKFMAKFGPEETLMEKIGSLLKASNANGNWLRMSKATATDGTMCGYFDEIYQNCVVIQKDGITKKIYNMVDTAATEQYLRDETGMTYNSWQDYFM